MATDSPREFTHHLTDLADRYDLQGRFFIVSLSSHAPPSVAQEIDLDEIGVDHTLRGVYPVYLPIAGR